MKLSKPDPVKMIRLVWIVLAVTAIVLLACRLFGVELDWIEPLYPYYYR